MRRLIGMLLLAGLVMGIASYESRLLRGAPPAPAWVAPAVPPEDEVSARLRVPDGFQVREFARLDVGAGAKPRLMTRGPDGAVYVADYAGSGGRQGRIVRLPDRNGDGRADAVEEVLTGLYGPHSAEWIDGCLYVAENDKVSRHCDADGDGSLEQHTKIADLPGPAGHTTRTLHHGPDGKLYVSAGSSCNVCDESDPRRAAILRFNLDGSIPADNPHTDHPEPRMHPVWALGLRNSIDFVFMPDGQLWANHNGRDNMINATAKNDRPLEEIIIPVQGGAHHGWPYCTSERTDGSSEPGVAQYAEVRDPSSDVPSPPDWFSCERAVPALATTTAHSAPIGMTRYDGTNFAPDYQGDVFVALHGSWNRQPPAPCLVVRVTVADGKPTGVEPFLTGFQDSADSPCGTAWGRPAGLISGGDGALYVSDDLNGRIYRIVSTIPQESAYVPIVNR